MKIKLFSAITILSLTILAISPMAAFAQAPAYQTSFTTSITYQNVDTAATTSLHILFYADATSTTPIDITRPNLPAGAGTSIFIGGVAELGGTFHGSAVMESDKALVATLVQLPQNSTTVKNRPLSNGFASGSPTVLLATVLKNNFNVTSMFSIQNTDGQKNTITVKLYDTTATLKGTITQDIESGASFLVDAGTAAQLTGTSFNGSAVVTAKRADNSDGSIVGTVMELSTNGPTEDAFEGVSTGATTVYMPSALCDFSGSGANGYNSSYAVQNTSLSTATDVTVTYSNGSHQTQTVGAGSKKSFIACAATGAVGSFSGSATITSLTTPIIAIGKVFGKGTSTAFVGATAGSAKAALPYIRWTQAHWTDGTHQRAFIAIQNIGSAAIPASQLQVKYADKDGNVLFTDTNASAIDVGKKFNSNPFVTSQANMAEFGFYSGGVTGGSAIVQCNAPSCQIVAIARIQSINTSDGTTVGEDYNGIPVP